MSSGQPERERQAAIQSAWARVLLDSLADAGVHDVVISPGSRSTPFVLAALRARLREGRSELRCHDVTDERSAAFFALGRARVTGRPSLVICTSGSAAGHYLPAVLEAEADHLPLMILSADRPVELLGCGANQTLDQSHLFGRHVRRFFDLGLADGSADALRGLRRLAAQAVFASLYPTPGAVHLNGRARKPLEPPTLEPPAAPDLPVADEILRRLIAVPSAPRRMPQAREVDLFLDRAAAAASGLIVCGPAHLDQGEVRDRLRLLANKLRWPVVADATSQLRDADTVHGAEALLKTSFADRQAPSMVLQIGRAPASSAWLGAIKSWCTNGRCRDHWVVAGHGWNDPESTATHLLWSDADAFVDGLLERIDHFELPHASAAAAQAVWRKASELARHAAYELVHEPSGDDGVAEPVLIRQTVAALPAGAHLMLGNSLPVRETDLWVEGEELDGRGVLHQRGLSGIDGNVAGAVGAAVGGTPTLLLLGDVSLRHDLGSLELARRAPSLVIAVVDNCGGRIFEHLPLATHAAAGDEIFGHWLQPGSLDLEAVARAQGLSYVRPQTPQAVSAAVRDAFAAGGAWLLDLKAQPESAVRCSRRLTERLQRALAEEGLC